ncbi:DUF6375 family protein (plasmid) [Glycocaulis abyssi]|uniref:DUF6375 family protein n=1 Tax=Glycocaulis abyssi TaxID=1433403 RepID=A0ABV9NCK9_9PROT
MKLWNGYGSEHSANLVLIGEFEGVDKAEKALQLLNEVAEVAQADEADGLLEAGKVSTRFSDRVLDLLTRANLSLDYGDTEELLYEFGARREGEKVIITTEELSLNAFMKVLLHGGAKIEVYSRHDHPGPYGRPTS